MKTTLGEITCNAAAKSLGKSAFSWIKSHENDRQFWEDVGEAVRAHILANDPEVVKMREALYAVKQRIHFIGWPNEKMMDGQVGSIPDWRKEIALIEDALKSFDAALQNKTDRLSKNT